MVVFSPKWSLPRSIIYKETIPAVRENKKYLEEHNMQVVDKEGNEVDPSDVDWDDDPEKFPYDIFQKPGENNALGRIKFLLPNSHSIYLHDTPAKSLFREKDRAFSHGCIRVAEPVKLAGYLLRDQKAWTKDSIFSAMNKDKETIVRLSKKVPVYLTYFTAWTDANHKIHFADDIYEHDRKLSGFLN
jgi:murein L,D-transpeptidase YcbB/YkuD